MSDRFVKVDLDEQECKMVAEAMDALEQIARMNNWNSAQEQLARVTMSRVRAKMNVAASLFTGGRRFSEFEIQQQLPPWLRRQ